ncbi:hypothetical protein APHAL10511_003919 [Amanita phalloides]|nr:hypothetical protein APHAL10511_003919 [Amanita phalloides]
MHSHSPTVEPQDMTLSKHASNVHAATKIALSKRKDKDAENSAIIKPYCDAARFIPHAINPFIRVQEIMKIGFFEWISLTGDKIIQQIVKELPEETLADELDKFDHAMDLVPGFQGLLHDFTNDYSKMLDFFDFNFEKLNDQASSGQSDDSKQLKWQALKYLLEDPKVMLEPPLTRIYEGVTKSGIRGFYHPVCARLLCPQQELVAFDKDPDAFMDEVITGSRTITENSWPSFLYDPTLYNPAGCNDQGLLHGHYLIHVYCHLITGLASALNPGKHSKHTHQPKCHIHQYYKSDPYTIAYVAVQVT